MQNRQAALWAAGFLLATGALGTAQAAGLTDMVSGLGGTRLPDVSSTSSGNAAGVVSYCVKNNYLKSDSAGSVLSKLTGQSGVTQSSDYSLGESGKIDSGNGQTFSLSGVQDKIKAKLCDMVLQHAKSLI